MAAEGARHQEEKAGSGREEDGRRHHAGVAARWIAPRQLISLVQNTAPFLFEGDGAFACAPEREFLGRLRAAAQAPSGPEARPEFSPLEYFQLCLASHFATAATFVPTDVDTKIRGILWRETRDREVLRAMCEYALGAAAWDLRLVSRRVTTVPGAGDVSGHNGEWLSVIAAAHGRFLALGDAEYAEKTALAIDLELAREAGAFEMLAGAANSELDVLRLSVSLTHNCGDIDQAISFWSKGEVTAPSRRRFHRLAHENRTPYGGVFQIASQLYRQAMAAEGHRNYPLRAARGLRRSPDFLLPLAPFLDDWGAMIATHPRLSPLDRSEVAAALISGCRKIANQTGYYRALHGLSQASGGASGEIVQGLSGAARRDLRDLRKLMDVARVSFESSMKKKVAAALGK